MDFAGVGWRARCYPGRGEALRATGHGVSYFVDRGALVLSLYGRLFGMGGDVAAVGAGMTK